MNVCSSSPSDRLVQEELAMEVVCDVIMEVVCDVITRLENAVERCLVLA